MSCFTRSLLFAGLVATLTTTHLPTYAEGLLELFLRATNPNIPFPGTPPAGLQPDRPPCPPGWLEHMTAGRCEPPE